MYLICLGNDVVYLIGLADDGGRGGCAARTGGDVITEFTELPAVFVGVRLLVSKYSMAFRI